MIHLLRVLLGLAAAYVLCCVPAFILAASAQGDKEVDAASAEVVFQQTLALGGLLMVFVGVICAALAAIAWAVGR